jgi:hypothetical protein
MENSESDIIELPGVGEEFEKDKLLFESFFNLLFNLFGQFGRKISDR